MCGLDADATAILGPGRPVGSPGIMVLEQDAPHGVDLTHLGTGDITLGVEGLEFAGEVELKMELLDETQQPVDCEDVIQLKVAPFILLGHLQAATASYVSRITGDDAQESEDYCTFRFPTATPAGITDQIIPPTLNDGCDPWAQDEFQIGFQEAPYKSMYVVLDSKRDRGLEPFPRTLLGPDFGHLQIDNGADANTFDSFGNLEVCPPCTVGDTEYPFGRIYYGDNADLPDDERMDADLRAFLARQQVQSPVTFETDWLLVGHVDEFMSIIPNADATHGWTVLLADPELALDILEGDLLVAGGVDPLLSIHRYMDHSIPPPPDPPTHYTVDTLSALLSRPLGFHVPETGTIQDHNISTVIPMISPLESAISDAFGFVVSTDIFRVPVLFNAVGGASVGITPNLANGGVYDSVYIAPDVFLHVHDPTGATEEEDLNWNFQLDTWEDLNSNGLLDTYHDAFSTWLGDNFPPGVAAEYLDDWTIYHLGYGEVHCSSNERRSRTFTVKWWDYNIN